MVVLVDLDDDDAPSLHAPRVPGFIRDVKPVHHAFAPRVATDRNGHHTMVADERDRPNPNVNGFSAALSCYP